MIHVLPIKGSDTEIRYDRQEIPGAAPDVGKICDGRTLNRGWQSVGHRRIAAQTATGGAVVLIDDMLAELRSLGLDVEATDLCRVRAIITHRMDLASDAASADAIDYWAGNAGGTDLLYLSLANAGKTDLLDAGRKAGEFVLIFRADIDQIHMDFPGWGAAETHRGTVDIEYEMYYPGRAHAECARAS